MKPLLGAVAGEIAATARTGMFPFSRLRAMPKPRPRPDRIPVVLVHGYLGHPDMMRPLARTLLVRGWPQVERVAWSSFTHDLDEILTRIQAAVDRCGPGPVDLVGHSLGAVACRAWLKERGGAARARRFVSLAAPFGGTSWYRFVVGPLRQVLDPRGEVVQRLSTDPEPVPTTVIRARFDHQVFPAGRGLLDGCAREVVLEGIGHNGLLWSQAAHEAVVEALTEPAAAAA